MPFDRKLSGPAIGLAGLLSLAASTVALAQSGGPLPALPASAMILAQAEEDGSQQDIIRRKRREQQEQAAPRGDENNQIRRQQQQQERRQTQDEQRQRQERRQQQIEEQQQQRRQTQDEQRQRQERRQQQIEEQQQQRRQTQDEQRQRQERRQQQIEERQQQRRQTQDEQRQRQERRQQQIEERQQNEERRQQQDEQRQQERRQQQNEERRQQQQERQQQGDQPRQDQPDGQDQPTPRDNQRVVRPEPQPVPEPGAEQPRTRDRAPAAARYDAPLDAQSDEAVRQRMLDARRALGDKNLSTERRKAIEDDMARSRRELQTRQARGNREWGAGEPTEGGAVINLPRAGRPNPVVEAPRVDRDAARRADALLAEDQAVDRLDDDALSGRLDRYRAALSQGNLPRDRERELRRRLATDRAALRDRVSRREAEDARRGAGGRDGGIGRPIVVLPPTPRERDEILADRRRGRDLDEVALNRRIQAYRYALEDERLDAAEREAYIRYLEDDRRELRGRLADDRRLRAERYSRMRDRRELDIDMDVILVDRPDYRPRTVIWAAEVDDELIEDQLIARPLQPIEETWTRAEMIEQPEVVMARPEVRQALPSVELDTVRFGFNEDFVREEEIANIDRIGKIVEKIVAAHPNEVFMIEGHTDAVGGDAYNLALSKRRADAVKAALTEYYVIAPENLATVGLGERYLKIPTPDEEPENRRVTLRRVTPLIRN